MNTITEDRLRELENKEKMLETLILNGVKEWEGYEESLKETVEKEKEDLLNLVTEKVINSVTENMSNEIVFLEANDEIHDILIEFVEKFNNIG